MQNRKYKRRANGEGSIRKLPNGLWEGRYTAGRNPGTGRQNQKSVYARTQKEVKEKLSQAISNLQNDCHSLQNSKIRLSEWLDTWLKEYTLDLKPFTLASYTQHINKNIKPYLGAVKLRDLTPLQIQRLYNCLYSGDKTRKPLSAKTIKNLHGVLHKALNQALELKMVNSNPSSICKLPKVIKTEIKPLDADSIPTFMKAIKENRFELLYLVTMFTGMRQGEILGLKWECVDFKKGVIKIDKQLQKEKKPGGKYFFSTLKNNKSREITPAPYVMELLKRQRTSQIENRLKAGAIWENTDLVFTNEMGKNLSHAAVYEEFKHIVQKINMPHLRFHDLRHTYAVLSLKNGDNLKVIQENLGHHDASFTLNIYGHVSDDMKRESSRHMEELIMSISNL